MYTIVGPAEAGPAFRLMVCTHYRTGRLHGFNVRETRVKHDVVTLTS